MDRGTRRDRTNRIIAHRLALHMLFCHSNQSAWVSSRCRPCEDGPHFWATHHPCSCHCAKRAKNRPKVYGGMCCCGDRLRVLHWRNETKELNRLVTQGWDGASDQLATLWSQEYIRG
jgi:hypothetical protein